MEVVLKMLANMIEMWYSVPLLKSIDINKHTQILVIEHTNDNTKTTQTEDKVLSVINVMCFR